MTDIKLNPNTGDLIIDGGMQLVEGQEEGRQRLQQALSINLGEWFADITAGLPWLENAEEDLPSSIRYMLGMKSANLGEFVSRTITDYIKQQNYVSSVEATFDFNRSTRQFTYNAKIVGIDGVEFTLTPFEIDF